MEPFIGQIICVGFNFAPKGWAFCNGQLLSIAQNQALFSLLGTMYGGDGQTTFGLPDLRGRAPIGMGQGPGLSNYVQGHKAGVENVTLNSNQMPRHTHALGNMTIKVTDPGFVEVPVNTEESIGKVSGPTGFLTADATPGTYTSAGPSANAFYTGKPLPVKSLQISGSGGTIDPSGGSQPFSVMQPYLGMNYCIALEGIYPSRQ
jgi:microcystin-dependent protein